MSAKKKIKRGFYFRGDGNFSTLFEHEIYHWDGEKLEFLDIVAGRDIWINSSVWGKDFKEGTVNIGDDKQFTYLGE